MTTTYAFNTSCNFVCKNETLTKLLAELNENDDNLQPVQKTEILKILKKFNVYYDPDNVINADIISKFKVLLSTLKSNCKGKYKEGIEIVRPWTRFRATCPSNNKVAELNMRRKAEVLKYTNNTNKLSQKQRYSMAARNLLTKRKSWANQKLGQKSNPNTSNLKPVGYFANSFDNTTSLSWSGLRCCKAEKPVTKIPSNDPQQNNYGSCNKTEPLQISTTASDVPGKPRMLTLDPNVPLTMYPPVRRTYRAGANKWPQFGWYPGLRGFPVGKKGSLFP